jgi:hypothetical protein
VQEHNRTGNQVSAEDYDASHPISFEHSQIELDGEPQRVADQEDQTNMDQPGNRHVAQSNHVKDEEDVMRKVRDVRPGTLLDLEEIYFLLKLDTISSRIVLNHNSGPCSPLSGSWARLRVLSSIFGRIPRSHGHQGQCPRL